jgi:Derlin-2/3
MGLIMSIIYLWSRKHPPITMSFLFGIQFPSFYFPWALVAFNVLLGGFPLTELMGILVGHIYYFFEEIYPATSGIRLLKTPKFM